MKYLLLTLIVFLSYVSESQCNSWQTDDFDSFEYTTNCPYLIPGSVYHLNPKGSGHGPSYTGNLHLYLNFQNGFTGVALDRPYTVCVGNTYRISFYHRDAWGGSNNTTFNIYDANNVLLSSDNVPWSGNTWNNYVSPPLVATTTILRLEVVNNQTTGNNDMVIDDMSLESCGVQESVPYLICNQTSTVDLFSLFSSTMPAGGTWTGPSALANGDLGTYDPATNALGVYEYTAPGQSCIPPSEVTVTAMNDIDLGNDTSICDGAIVTLDAGPGFDVYTWSTGASTQTINVAQTGTYWVEGGVPTSNLIQNGDFEGGTTAAQNNFTTSYNPGMGGAWGLLSAPGTYAISTSPSLVHNNFPVCADHTTGTGNMLVANGASTANTTVWSQTVPINPNTDYQFSYWATRVSNDPSASDLQLFINGTAIGPVNSTGGVCSWQQVADVWNSGAATSAVLNIVNQSTSASGNDFAVDDIFFGTICTTSDTIQINVESPSQIVTSTDPSCNGLSDGSINISNALGVDFSIDNGTTWQTDSSFLNLAQGNYQVCSRTALGCIVCDNVTLTDPAPVVLTVSADTTICENGTGNLSASATGGTTFNFHWNHTTDLSGNQTVNPSSQTSYIVYAENENGCVSPADTIDVSLYPPLTGTISSPISICPTDAANLVATASGGIGAPYTFTWTTGETMATNGTHQISVSPNDTTVYSVTINDGCETTPITMSTTVNVAPLPNPQYVVTNPNQCEPATFEVVNTTNPLWSQSVSWLVAGQFPFTGDTIYPTGLMAGDYDIQMTVVSPQGCIDSTLFVGALHVDPIPTASFTYSPNPVTMFNTEVTMFNSSANATTYQWWFNEGDPSTSMVEHPTTIFPDGQLGTYPVTLVATSSLGCSDTVTVDIVVHPEVIIYAPNTFTPDGDEFNQNWMVHMEGVDKLGFELYIYNRWGELVWESHDIEVGWDGTYKGRPAKVGTYTWVLKAKDLLNDSHHVFNGHLNLMR